MHSEEKTFKLLEWNIVLEKLASFATCSIGKQRCLDTPVFTDIKKIQEELALTTQAKFLLDHQIHPPMGGITDIFEFVDLARSGHTLRSTELIDVAKAIGASRRLKSFLIRYQEEAPELAQLNENLYENKELEENILDIFDNAGNVLDSASPELKRLRNSLKDQTFNLKNKLNHLIQSSQVSKYLQESVYTQREDRYVIPVKAEFKSLVPGIVHDTSSSGATFFIEPKAIVELNNSIRETELKIDQEIRRIFAELSNKIGENSEEITRATYALAEFDFIFAKAKYSIFLKAIEPDLNNDKYLSLKSVKHPVLMTVIEEVIPNDFEIGKDWTSLIITGSNTGGKTVLLKTVGLSVLMTKAGLHIPAHEANIYPFKNIFVDIGDEQSVIQSLSTFSGHMVNIINILNAVNDNSLVLFDEVGAGTDPSEGSALAQSILEELYSKGARTIVTTHYGELKSLAYTQKGFYNASVEFNVETLAPTYKLLMGIPGKSNAITIASNLGLSKSVADKAQEIYLTQKDPSGIVLEELQSTQQRLSKDAQKVEETKDELEKLEKEYNENIEKLRQEKKKTLTVYKKKFESEILAARSELKGILNEIKRTKSEKLLRRGAGKITKVESGLRDITAEEQEGLEPEIEKVDWNNVQIGDQVYLKDLEQDATLLRMPDKNKNVQVQIGLLKTNVKASKIYKSERKKSVQEVKTQEKYKNFKLTKIRVSNKLDLRGFKVEDALIEVDLYLDEAALSNLTPVYLIHGHGTGALKQAIRDYLKSSPYVANFRSGDKSEGGDGVSVVDLK